MDILPTAVMMGFAGLTGATVCSFGATAAIRMAAGEQPWSGRSRCDGCSRTLGWSETVPFAGFVLAQGRCRSCGHSIDRFHLLGEGAGAIAAMLSLAMAPDAKGVVIALLALVLTVQSLIDLRTLRLPDIGNLLVAGLCLGLAVMSDTLVEGVIAALTAATLLLGIKAILERGKGRTLLGLGDVKLVAALALVLGQWTAAMVAVASLLALGAMLLLRKGSQDKLPFGPAIAIAGFAFVLGLAVLERQG